jgi:hypothetical protein
MREPLKLYASLSQPKDSAARQHPEDPVAAEE